MTRRPRTPLALLALAALALLAGCGNQKSVVTAADTEGPYLDVGPLQYQVQISRQLNPHDNEDRSYLVGVPNPDGLKPNETWFAVFIRVKNPTGRFVYPARQFEITDTQGNTYTPLPTPPTNQYVYRGGVVPAGGTIQPK